MWGFNLAPRLDFKVVGVVHVELEAWILNIWIGKALTGTRTAEVFCRKWPKPYATGVTGVSDPIGRWGILPSRRTCGWQLIISSSGGDTLLSDTE